MKTALVVLVVLSALGCELTAARSPSNSLAWRRFKRQYGKIFETAEEEARRFRNFITNKEFVDSHNANASASFTMALNHMADWSPEEYASLNGAKPPNVPLDIISHQELEQILGSASGAPVPDQIDWRKVNGRVSGAKTQGGCGSCWAFATTGLLEGQELVQNMSSLIPLSEQQLIDCGVTTHACEGGWMSNALDDLANKVGGIESESDYPYWSAKMKCMADRAKFQPLKIKGHKMLPAGDEKTLKQVVANYGPVAIAFDASWGLHFYHKGVYVDHKCKANNANHAVLVVGYGKDPKKGDYWIIKNSWSDGWGDKGFMLFKAGINMCGVADYGTIATFS